MLLIVDNKKYILKFGLKELIELDDFLSNNSEADEDIDYFKFYLAIRNNHLSEKQIQKLYFQVSNVKEKTQKALEESLGTTGDSSEPIRKQIEELYKIAVGEIGISPQCFYDMTPHEITLAYKGYLDKKILEANLFILAQLKMKQGELINLYGDGVNESTIEKRNQVFSALKIERTDI